MGVASSVLLMIAGLWVLFQAIAGDLPGRLLSYRNAGSSTSSNTKATGT